MGNYFCGWYYRCQSDDQTLAIIPSVHKTKDGEFCAIQLITDTASFMARFPCSHFQKKGDRISIGRNRFGKEGLYLDINSPELRVTGEVRFGQFETICYDIMGPFRYVPFMQCRHGVYSMRHRVDGEISVNGVSYVFRDAVGYVEGDRGSSFPKKYAWTQCSFPGGALMLSVADIPFGLFRFTGVIGIIMLNGKEYRLASYLGARAEKIKNACIDICQGSLSLRVIQKGEPGHPLCAPHEGEMSRTIHEHPSCKVYYLFKDGSRTLLEIEANNAAFEYEY